MGDLVDGKVRIEDIREVGLEDLLGRDPVPPVEELLSTCILDKNVMVTGAGGSIGSELCRQIIKQNPRVLVLFELSEYNLYKIERELLKNDTNTQVVSVLGDINSKDIVDQVIFNHNIDTIYHAAAYKHVPLIENNIVAGVVNNVFGVVK